MATQITDTQIEDNIIAQKLRDEMGKIGVSSLELARRSDVKPSFIYDILNGKSTNPSTIKLAKVAKSLGVSLMEFVECKNNLLTDFNGIEGSNNRKDIRFDGNDNFSRLPFLSIEAENGKDVISEKYELGLGYFNIEWLRNHLNVTPQHAAIVSCQDDTMFPTMNSGDMIIIDRHDNDAFQSGIFAVCNGRSIIFRRIEYQRSGDSERLRLIADNRRYGSVRADIGKVQIIGRAIWVFGKIC